ncbi:hypothetical protein AB4084_09705, partial [Lysobacter sp. 2RAB21]
NKAEAHSKAKSKQNLGNSNSNSNSNSSEFWSAKKQHCPIRIAAAPIGSIEANPSACRAQPANRKRSSRDKIG